MLSLNWLVQCTFWGSNAQIARFCVVLPCYSVLSGIVWEWEHVSQCINFGNGNGNDHVGMGGIGNTESHSRTPLLSTVFLHESIRLIKLVD